MLLNTSGSTIGIDRRTFKTLLFIILFTVIRVLTAIAFNIISKHISTKSILEDLRETENVYTDLRILVILGPMLKTFLFQYIPFKYLLNKCKPALIIMLSSLLFGIWHFYNPLYILSGICAGLIYNVAYYFKRNSNPFVITFTIHSLYNLIAFIINNSKFY
ncbi:CPBP family intramembrane glutamic endopeptidase [Chryseosolibacter indicus]|uniref:CPBP family intramembrane metalloprotease n=1 Tax=Chryseosolibacter indicus TaxID=2782351 RepID=A0ABS5VV55_9BACT|nr:CPBP family intramembrane metalloprotease [Chryseosolibacter indicus]